MACVLLPCEAEEWWEHKRLFLLLSHLRTVGDLETLICSHTRQGCENTTLSQRLKDLKGFLVFLKDFCDQEERDKCISVTLPFIAESAARLEDLVPESGIPFIVQNEAASVVLGRKLILSLLANAFLCTFTQPEYGAQKAKKFSFDGMFSHLTEKRPQRPKAVANKIKCFLCYFNTVAEGRVDLSGVITIKRQVVILHECPSLEQWTGCRKPLCDLTVDHDNLIENSGSHTLQVDFANKKIGGGALRSGCVQEEIRFTICPELTVAMLVMDVMRPNEAIIINGAQQFSNYFGYGDSFLFTGEHVDQAERDVFGNLLTSVVAIDALSLGGNPDKQYQQDMLLRELNKAYTGFLCLDQRGDMYPGVIALRSRGPSVSYIAEYYPNHYSYGETGHAESALGNMALLQASEGVTATGSGKMTPLSPIHEISEAAISSIITENIMQEAVNSVTANGSIGNYADQLASSLFITPISLRSAESAKSNSRAKVESEGVDQFASGVAASLFSDVSTSAKDTGVESLAFSLSEAILNSASQPPALSESTADEMARNIISDVFSSLTPPSSPEGVPPQTHGQSSNQPLSSLSEKLATGILSDALSEPSKPVDHPAIYIQVERRGSSGVIESPRSSRSSSLTGQTITVHEFTDDLAENLLRDGLSIAQYSSQSMELNIKPRLSEEDAKSIADDMSQAILASVKSSCKPAPPKTLAVEHAIKPPRRLLFSKQELAIVAARMTKRGSIDQIEASEFDTSLQLNPRLLTPSSSRHSFAYAWSNASTRGEGSRPVSPTELDRLALDLATDLNEFSRLFSKILVSDAILSVTGERPRREQNLTLFGKLKPVPLEQDLFLLNYGSLSQQNKIDAYFSGLEQAESLPQDSPEPEPAGLPERLRTVLLRPVATGNWGCGAFHGSPQLKALIQLIAVSMCDRPQMMYYSFKNKELDKLESVYANLRSLNWSCGQLCAALLDYCQLSPEDRKKKDLFTTLLEK